MLQRSFFPLLVAIALTASPAWSVEHLSIQEAVSQALSRNPEIRAAEREIDAARARETQAGVLPNPNLSLAVDEVPINSQVNGNYMAGISQPLLLGGQREARQALAQLERELAELELQTLRRDLSARVKDAYIRLLFDVAGVNLAKSGEEAAETQLDASQKRYKAGEVARIEVLRAEVERNRARREVAAATNRMYQGRSRLNVLLGREAPTPVAVQELAAPQAKTLPALPTLVTRALETRIELRQAELAIERETMQRRVAQASLWTGTEASVLAGAVDGGPGISASVTLPIPVYRQQGEIAEAEANRARAEARRDALRLTITSEVDEAYREAQSAAEQAGLYTKSYVPLAERLVENAQKRFAEGAGSGLEVIEARRALRETRTEYQQALLEYREALARLERAVGVELIGS
ncbi:Cobalt-zinc-cadmium resistance protein CzcC precursor [compost metagenome]